MNPAAANYSFRGLADMYIKPYLSNGPLRPLGSVSVCKLAPTVDTKKQKNYGKAGGLVTTSDRLTAIAVTMTLQSVSIANLALSLRGGVTDITSGTVASGSAEVHAAYTGALIRLAFINPNTCVVKDSTGTTTFVAGEDYTVTGAGIVILAGGAIDTAIQAATADPTTGLKSVNVKVSYAYSAQQVIQALTQGAGEYTIAYDGINEDDNNNPTVVDLWRLRPGIVKEIGAISDDYVTLELAGDLLLDTTQTGAGLSQFFQWTYASAS